MYSKDLPLSVRLAAVMAAGYIPSFSTDAKGGAVCDLQGSGLVGDSETGDVGEALENAREQAETQLHNKVMKHAHDLAEALARYGKIATVEELAHMRHLVGKILEGGK